jgi:hypothetical protein
VDAVPLRRWDDGRVRLACDVSNWLRPEAGTSREALLRRRKPWYYEQEPRPGVSVIGARLSELAALR